MDWGDLDAVRSIVAANDGVLGLEWRGQPVDAPCSGLGGIPQLARPQKKVPCGAVDLHPSDVILKGDSEGGPFFCIVGARGLWGVGGWRSPRKQIHATFEKQHPEFPPAAAITLLSVGRPYFYAEGQVPLFGTPFP